MGEQKDRASSAPKGRSASGRYGSVISTRPLPLDVDRRSPWNKWWHKAIHYWRYGYSHPDEDLMGVIEAVGDALHVEVITAKAILGRDCAHKADQIKKDLDDELKKTPPDFSTLLAIESQINALYPADLARRRQWVLRDRFDRVAPPAAVQNWQIEHFQAQVSEIHAAAARKPADKEPVSSSRDKADKRGGGAGGGAGGAGGGGTGDGKPAHDPDALNEYEADAQTLLGYIHTNYLMTIGREKAVRDLKRWLLMRFILFLIVLTVTLSVVWTLLWVWDMGQYWGLLLGLFLIAAAGRAGATTSIIRRLQNAISNNVLASDPIIELTALRTGKNEISMALASASIFALLMWAFFASGLPERVGLEGGLFPQAIAAQPAAPAASAGNKDQRQTTGQSTGNTVATSNSSGEAGQGNPPPAKGVASAQAPAPTPPSAQTPAPTPPLALPAQTGAPAANAVAARPASAPPSTTDDRDLTALVDSVRDADRRYRETMTHEAQATGISNWFERRRIREQARVALATAVVNQQEVVDILQARWVAASSGTDQALAERLNERTGEARDKLNSLRTLQRGLNGGDAKPAPGVACPPDKVCNPFPDLARALRLANESDFFKMLLWAFIAGFAERFVPDMLDRVVARGGAARASASTAAFASQVSAMTVPATSRGGRGVNSAPEGSAADS